MLRPLRQGPLTGACRMEPSAEGLQLGRSCLACKCVHFAACSHLNALQSQQWSLCHVQDSVRALETGTALLAAVGAPPSSPNLWEDLDKLPDQSSPDSCQMVRHPNSLYPEHFLALRRQSDSVVQHISTGPSQGIAQHAASWHPRLPLPEPALSYARQSSQLQTHHCAGHKPSD